MHPGIVHIRKWRSLSPRAPKTNTCKGFSGLSRMCMISKLYLLVPLLPSGTMDAVALRLLPPLAVSLPTSQPPVYRLLSDIVYYCRTSLHAHAPIASRTQIRSSCTPATAGRPVYAVSQATTTVRLRRLCLPTPLRGKSQFTIRTDNANDTSEERVYTASESAASQRVSAAILPLPNSHASHPPPRAQTQKHNPQRPLLPDRYRNSPQRGWYLQRPVRTKIEFRSTLYGIGPGDALAPRPPTPSPQPSLLLPSYL